MSNEEYELHINALFGASNDSRNDELLTKLKHCNHPNSSALKFAADLFLIHLSVTISLATLRVFKNVLILQTVQ